MNQIPAESHTDNLARDLRQAEVIKQNMAELMSQLETKATGKTIPKPGGWRHHPLDWAEQNPSQNLPIN